MAKKSFSVLSLGTRKDAETWESGCKGLGMELATSIRKGKPTVDELKTLFSGSPHWIYFGGHFLGMELYNESKSVKVNFKSDGVKLIVAGATTELKMDKGFNLHKNCEVVLWGGCSVCSGIGTMMTMREVFGDHVLLGFNGLTGWQMVNAMLGGDFMKKGHFFDRVSKHTDAPVEIRNAWMNAAKQGYGGGGNEHKFRAVDRDGQEWELADGKVKKGRIVK